MNQILFLILLLILNTNEDSDLNNEAQLKFDDPDIYEPNEAKKQEKLTSLVNKYIEKQKWDKEKEINKNEFSKMFENIIQKSALKQDSLSLLQRFTEKAMNEFGEPIIVKNLEKCFELKKLRKIYLLLFNPELNTDL